MINLNLIRGKPIRTKGMIKSVHENSYVTAVKPPASYMHELMTSTNSTSFNCSMIPL